MVQSQISTKSDIEYRSRVQCILLWVALGLTVYTWRAAVSRNMTELYCSAASQELFWIVRSLSIENVERNVTNANVSTNSWSLTTSVHIYNSALASLSTTPHMQDLSLLPPAKQNIPIINVTQRA
jgi:hypothetical protein